MAGLPASFLASGHRQYLDLGEVQVMSEIKLNGKELGILWKKPYPTEIGGSVRAGENHLEIQIVNLWPNRLIEDERPPEDTDRKARVFAKAYTDQQLDQLISQCRRM